MEIEVVVGGWEHMCCGAAISVGDNVSWDIWWDDGAYRETHHVAERGMTRVEGRVTGVAARFDDGRMAAIERVPSGRALCGFAGDESSVLVEAVTGKTIDETAGGYRVRLSVADDAPLPK